jgi:uncharacterized protein (TIGR02284 family)
MQLLFQILISWRKGLQTLLNFKENIRNNMETNSELISVMNDLIKINHDRTKGYQKAADELKPTDIDLKTMFTNMANASMQNANALTAEVRNHGGDPASDSTQSGKIYRIWMDIRSGVSARDRKSVLSLCEFGEDAALKSYKLALESDTEIPKDIRQLIVEQQEEIQKAHDIVKRHRDMQEALSS